MTTDSLSALDTQPQTNPTHLLETQGAVPCGCGGTAIYHFDLEATPPYGHSMVCSRCASSTGSCRNKEHAIESWNIARTGSPVPQPLAPCEFHDDDQAACRQYSGEVPCQPAVAREGWVKQKPVVAGAYWIRGPFLERPALIEVREDEGELWCNLHASTTETDFGYGYRIAQLDGDFEYLGPLVPAGQQMPAATVMPGDGGGQ